MSPPAARARCSTGATLTVKRVRGIRRAALAPVLPAGEHGVVLSTVGPTWSAPRNTSLQFAFMGSFYAQHILGCGNPRVGLLSNGTEPTKGGELQKHAFRLLQEAADAGRLNFIGNIEGNDVMAGRADVAVTDGFTGNVFPESQRGHDKVRHGQAEGRVLSEHQNKLAALALKGDFKAMKDGLDVNKIGGTALLGISKPVIKGPRLVQRGGHIQRHTPGGGFREGRG